MKPVFVFRIFRLHHTAFSVELIFTVMSHDMRHVTQAGAWPVGDPGQCLCLVTASPVYVNGLFIFHLCQFSSPRISPPLNEHKWPVYSSLTGSGGEMQPNYPGKNNLNQKTKNFMLSVHSADNRQNSDIRNAILTSTVNLIRRDSLQMPQTSSLMEAHYETAETIARRL